MLISPSILQTKITNLKKQINHFKKADLIHLDIMDGIFVNNISFGPKIASEIASLCYQDVDIHLMLQNPLSYLEKFNYNNTRYITVHYETENLDKSILKIKSLNKKVGVSIKPKTDVKLLNNILPNIDLVLVMSVEPGFGGQKFMPEALDKIKYLDNFRKENNLNFLIEVDGGINLENASMVKESGCDIIVVGSSLTSSKNPKKELLKYKLI